MASFHVARAGTTAGPADVAVGYSAIRQVSARRLLGQPLFDSVGNPVGIVRDAFLELPSSSVHYIEVSGPRGYVRIGPLTGVVATPSGSLRLSANGAAWGQKIGSDATRLVVSGRQRISTLLARPVTAKDGVQVGDVDDVVLDLRHDRVGYVVVRFKPGILRGNTLLALDPTSFSGPEDVHEPLRLTLTEHELHQRIGYTPGEWEELQDRTQWAATADDATRHDQTHR